MAGTESDVVREQARAALVLLGEGLARGEPPDAETSREFAERAARVDAHLWGQGRAGACAR